MVNCLTGVPRPGEAPLPPDLLHHGARLVHAPARWYCPAWSRSLPPSEPRGPRRSGTRSRSPRVPASRQCARIVHRPHLLGRERLGGDVVIDGDLPRKLPHRRSPAPAIGPSPSRPARSPARCDSLISERWSFVRLYSAHPGLPGMVRPLIGPPYEGPRRRFVRAAMTAPLTTARPHWAPTRRHGCDIDQCAAPDPNMLGAVSAAPSDDSSPLGVRPLSATVRERFRRDSRRSRHLCRPRQVEQGEPAPMLMSMFPGEPMATAGRERDRRDGRPPWPIPGRRQTPENGQSGRH